MRRPTTVAALVAGAALGAGLLTGCAALGTGTAYKTSAFSADSMSPAAAVQAATAATEKTGSASIRLTVTAQGAGVGEDATVEVAGVAALDGSVSDLRATVPGEDGPMTVQQRMVDGVLYLRVSGSGFLPDTWVKLDPAALPEGAGEGLGDMLGGAGPGTVTAPLDALREVADVEKVGSETIDGIATTHYRATLDPAKVAAALDAFRMLERGRPVGPGAAPVDLWVDGEGHVVRMTQTIDLGKAGGGSVTWTLDLREFGEPVEVTAPSGAVDLGAILGGLASLGSGSGSGDLGDLSGLLDGLGAGSGSGGEGSLEDLSGLLEDFLDDAGSTATS
jgi:hypothetical protein